MIVVSGQRSDVSEKTGAKRMSEKITGLALCTLLFALCFPAEAQQPKKVPRIGYLSNIDPASDSARSEAIRLALRELGYIEGQNLVRINVLDGCASISAMATSRTSGRRATRLSCASMPTATEYFFTIVQY
jgi:hypothetical protein